MINNKIKYIRKIFFFTISLIFMSCFSIEQKKESFIHEMNYFIGKSVDNIPVPKPISIHHINDKYVKHIYEYKDTGCQWFMIIDQESRNITEWGYISHPDLYYHTFLLY